MSAKPRTHRRARFEPGVGGDDDGPSGGFVKVSGGGHGGHGAAAAKKSKIRFAPPTDASNLSKIASKSGYLKKQADNEPGKWTKYYFVLRPATYLYYYNTPKDSEPRGIMDLEFLQDIRFNAECLQRSVGGSEHCFRVTGQMPPEFGEKASEKTKFRPLFLDTETKTESEAWMDAILNHRFDVERDEEFVHLQNSLEVADSQLTVLKSQTKEISLVSAAIVEKAQSYLRRLRGQEEEDIGVDTMRSRGSELTKADIAVAMQDIDNLFDEIHAEAEQQARLIEKLRQREADLRERDTDSRKRDAEFLKLEDDFRTMEQKVERQKREMDRQQRAMQKQQEDMNAMEEEFRERETDLEQRLRDFEKKTKDVDKKARDVDREIDKKQREMTKEMERRQKEHDKETDRRQKEFDKREKELEKKIKELEKKLQTLAKKGGNATLATAAIGKSESDQQANAEGAVVPAKKSKGLFKKPGFMKKKSVVTTEGPNVGDDENPADDDDGEYDEEDDPSAADMHAESDFSDDPATYSNSRSTGSTYDVGGVRSASSSFASSRVSDDLVGANHNSGRHGRKYSAVSSSGDDDDMIREEAGGHQAPLRQSRTSSLSGNNQRGSQTLPRGSASRESEETVSIRSTSSYGTTAMEPPPARDWSRRESRSNPGEFYFFNNRTGETSWEAPVAEPLPEEEEEYHVAETDEETEVVNVPRSRQASAASTSARKKSSVDREPDSSEDELVKPSAVARRTSNAPRVEKPVEPLYESVEEEVKPNPIARRKSSAPKPIRQESLEPRVRAVSKADNSWMRRNNNDEEEEAPVNAPVKADNSWMRRNNNDDEEEEEKKPVPVKKEIEKPVSRFKVPEPEVSNQRESYDIDQDEVELPKRKASARKKSAYESDDDIGGPDLGTPKEIGTPKGLVFSEIVDNNEYDSDAGSFHSPGSVASALTEDEQDDVEVKEDAPKKKKKSMFGGKLLKGLPSRKKKPAMIEAGDANSTPKPPQTPHSPSMDDLDDIDEEGEPADDGAPKKKKGKLWKGKLKLPKKPFGKSKKTAVTSPPPESPAADDEHGAIELDDGRHEF
ncbi:hypothetical protein Poli38472_009237 [Pythium oligandrum]|uniref:WW domain-containing protein n=1 Tax=Pythium oligandrum TaxID=41045 RepID=A0A8K1FIJ9_PYTOL|nr:hypothetical protein Poli38472_009237 [Pythium oligandrum]|eukprot:TMW65070.1 hypothetical protein Poli38472_009237 [Pythium oligandrum]